MGMYALLLLSLLFLLFFSFLSISLYLLHMLLYLAVMDILEGSKATTDPTMPTIPAFAVPAAPTPMGPGNFLTFVFSSIKIFIISFIYFLRLFFMGLCCTLCSLSVSFPIEVDLTSWFEVSSSFIAIPNPASEAAAFFTQFDQAETNDLDLSDFCGVGSPYIDFHGFRVPEECITCLEVIYSSRGDFMQEFFMFVLLGNTSSSCWGV